MNSIASTSLMEEFVQLIQQGIESWTKAGEVVVRLIDEQGFTIQSIAEASDILNEDIVARFEQLGRRQIIPNLLISDFPATKHLYRLPYSEQKRLIDGQVELLVQTDRGTETMMVEVKNLTPAQCKQVFDRTCVRSIGGQRAFMESKKEEARLSSATFEVQPIYKVRGKKVVFTQPCELSSRELARILAEME